MSTNTTTTNEFRSYVQGAFGVRMVKTGSKTRKQIIMDAAHELEVDAFMRALALLDSATVMLAYTVNEDGVDSYVLLERFESHNYPHGRAIKVSPGMVTERAALEPWEITASGKPVRPGTHSEAIHWGPAKKSPTMIWSLDDKGKLHNTQYHYLVALLMGVKFAIVEKDANMWGQAQKSFYARALRRAGNPTRAIRAYFQRNAAAADAFVARYKSADAPRQNGIARTALIAARQER